MKAKYPLVIVLLSFFLIGCTGIGNQGGDMIASPKNKNIPIKGTWNISKYKIINEKIANKESLDDMIGKEAKFGTNAALFHEEIAVNPQYKSRKSTSSYYFVYFYKVNPKNLGINKDSIDIITIYSSDKLFYEFIRLDENTGIMYMEGAFLYLNRVSTEEPQYDRININPIDKKEEEVKNTSSGVLIGLRKDRLPNDKNKKHSEYRTIWIPWEVGNVEHIYEIPNLLVPRARGFWNVELEQRTAGNTVKESIKAYPIIEDNLSGTGSNGQAGGNVQGNNEGDGNSRFVNIMFASSDYLTVEIIDSSSGVPNMQRIRALPLDNVELGSGIKISDIIGQPGKLSMDQSAEAALTSINKELREVLEETPREDSFTVARRNGHWILRGRINARSSEYSDKYLDFNINMIPPSKLVNYDQLYVSWNKVKERVPEALDIYTSPNQDFAVILTESEILVYQISKGELSEEPVKRISVDVREKIIMAQWSKGDQMEKWNRFIKDNGKVIE